MISGPTSRRGRSLSPRFRTPCDDVSKLSKALNENNLVLQQLEEMRKMMVSHMDKTDERFTLAERKRSEDSRKRSQPRTTHDDYVIPADDDQTEEQGYDDVADQWENTDDEYEDDEDGTPTLEPGLITKLSRGTLKDATTLPFVKEKHIRSGMIFRIGSCDEAELVII